MPTRKVSARLQKAIAAAEKERTKVYDKLFDVISRLGFGEEYADRAAGDIADDWMEGQVEDDGMPEVPFWHEEDYTPIPFVDNVDEEEEEEEIVEGAEGA